MVSDEVVVNVDAKNGFDFLDLLKYGLHVEEYSRESWEAGSNFAIEEENKEEELELEEYAKEEECELASWLDFRDLREAKRCEDKRNVVEGAFSPSPTAFASRSSSFSDSVAIGSISSSSVSDSDKEVVDDDAFDEGDAEGTMD